MHQASAHPGIQASCIRGSGVQECRPQDIHAFMYPSIPASSHQVSVHRAIQRYRHPGQPASALFAIHTATRPAGLTAHHPRTCASPHPRIRHHASGNPAIHGFWNPAIPLCSHPGIPASRYQASRHVAIPASSISTSSYPGMQTSPHPAIPAFR